MKINKLIAHLEWLAEQDITDIYKIDTTEYWLELRSQSGEWNYSIPNNGDNRKSVFTKKTTVNPDIKE